MVKKVCIIIGVLLCLAVGCGQGNARGKTKTDPLAKVTAPATLVAGPAINQYADPDFKIADCKTFCVLPESEVTGQASPAFGNELLEKQMLLLLRSDIEACGFGFEPDPKKADLIATISGSNEYKTQYIPPASITLPTYTSGRTITGRSHSYGNASVYGTYGSAYGTYDSSTNASVHVPGVHGSQTYDLPGHTVGHYYPTVTINIYSTKTNKSVWYGNGVACSDNNDIRVSIQNVMTNILFPHLPCDKMGEVYPNATGTLGLICISFTPDGSLFFPIVTEAFAKKPAAKAGMKIGDIVTSINGVSTKNKTTGQIYEMIFMPAGTKFTIEVNRDGKTKTFEMISAPWE